MNLSVQSYVSWWNKKIFYGDYVKETFYPLELLNMNLRNQTGEKNKGENDVKMSHNNIRAYSNFIRKVYENFGKLKQLTFLTLTYAVNEMDIKKCKKDLALFFRKLKKYYSSIDKKLKYAYTYEYQGRGAVHFHIIFNGYVKNDYILQFWKHGLNKNIKVRKNTNENVAKYISKYVRANNVISKYLTKSVTDSKSKNQYDLNIKSYQFSQSCVNPRVEKQVMAYTIQQIIIKASNSENFKFFKKTVDDIRTIMCGASIDYKFQNWNQNLKMLN